MENSNAGDAQFIAALRNRDNAGVVSTKSVGASSQLARSLGLDGSFTASEVATIKGVTENSNAGDAQFIATLRRDVRG